MRDLFGREITYLRVSVTDLCNLRCQYCMPEAGVEKLAHEEILSVDEIDAVVRACARLGIRKIRLTGGEPLVRRGIVDICRNAAGTPGIEEVCLTTNGTLLPELAGPLREAGVQRLNISLDTMKADQYEAITRCGKLSDAMAGLAAAREAGFDRTKINCVLMGGVNDDEIADFVGLTREHPYAVRFIELMAIGQCASWDRGRFLSADEVLKRVPALEPAGSDGVSELYRVPGYAGTVGLIRPISRHFCPSCNRIRLTADGKLKPCLHSAQEIGLRGLTGQALEQTIREAILSKPQRHHLDGGAVSESLRGMNAIGG